MTFGEVAEAWLAEVRATRRPKTIQGYEIAIRQLFRFRPEIAARQLTRADLLALREHRVKVSAITANRDLRAIKACINWATVVAELDHPRVPMTKLLLNEGPRRTKALSPEQISRLFDAAALDLPVQVVLRVCYGTGMRISEVVALTWRDVDFDRGTITVRRSKTVAGTGRVIRAQALVSWLRDYRRTLRFRDAAPVCQMDLATGKAWTHRIHARVADVFARAGVEGRQKTHALRHTLATDLADAGVPVHVAQAILGHASPTVTLGIYTHARESSVNQGGDHLEEWRRSRSGEQV